MAQQLMMWVMKTIEWQGIAATDVWVHGDFFGGLEWHQMTMVSDTFWRIRLRLRPGTYHYLIEPTSRVFQADPPKNIWKLLRVEVPEGMKKSPSRSPTRNVSPSPENPPSPSESPARSLSPSLTVDPIKESIPDDIEDFDDFDGDDDDEEEDKGGDEPSVEKTLQQEFSLIVKEIETKHLNIRKPPVLRSPVSFQSKQLQMVKLSQFRYTFQILFQGSIHPMQEQVAKEMMKKITKSQAEAFQNIKYFDVFTIVPFFKSLGKRSLCDSDSPLSSSFFQEDRLSTV